MNENKCHFIGVGGIGMSALAEILLSRNCAVSGSDQAFNSMTDTLSKKGAKIYIGHSSKHVEKGSTVVFNTMVSQNNPEYKAALELDCRIMHRSDMLQNLMEGYKALAVTGSHGKTTTTALLTKVLSTAGLDPSFAVGGILVDFQTNGYQGKSDYFVAEADESDGTFLKYSPFGAIVTNLDLEHMIYFKTKDNLVNSFEAFFSRVISKEHLFFCGDDDELLNINQKLGNQAISYGFSEHNQLIVSNYRQKGWNSYFSIHFKGKTYEDIELALIGKHNALNGAAVFGLCLNLGIDENLIRKAFSDFQGVLRRCEKKGSFSGLLLLDDYAHHPTEIKATLKAIRSAILEKKLIAVFQLHRYTRTLDILGTFKGAFDEATEVIITDLYSAGEEPIAGISHENLLTELKELNLNCRYVPRQVLAKELLSHLCPHDVVVSLGAGDITDLADELIEHAKIKPVKKIRLGLVFGGRSSEHEISIRSAKNMAESINKEYYEPHFFGISKTGTWEHYQEFPRVDEIVDNGSTPIDEKIMTKINECDLFFPILHGSFGEDGTIQGFFEILDKPYVGCDTRSSAICMDKVITKQLMILNKIETSDFLYFTHQEWINNPDIILEKIDNNLIFPVYIKPAHLGSSIAVSRANFLGDCSSAIELAFKHDDKVLVENEVIGREIEFAVIGNEKPQTFAPGEIFTMGQVYTYEAKYLSSEMKTDKAAFLSQKLIEEGMTLAKKAYLTAGCKGLARVDFFLDAKEKYWLNEINPIPGFTSASLYPAMCEANGLKKSDLIDRLIILSQDKKRRQRSYEF